MSSLDGSAVLVAGASSGIGRAVSIAAARAGANVVVFARRASEVDRTVELATEAGGVAAGVAGDALDASDIARAVQMAIESFGALDIIVNCVGTNIPDRSLAELDLDRWRHVTATNLDAAFALTQAVLPHFRQAAAGLIVHVGSIAAVRPDLSGAGYQAAKAGVLALARATQLEEGAAGIRTTVIMPGLTDTPFSEHRPAPLPPEVLARALQPEDVAEICLAVLALPARAHVPELTILPWGD